VPIKSRPSLCSMKAVQMEPERLWRNGFVMHSTNQVNYILRCMLVCLEWYWKSWGYQMCLGLSAVIMGVLSAMVVWSECLFFVRSPTLSLFAVLVSVAKSGYSYRTIEVRSWRRSDHSHNRAQCAETISILCINIFYFLLLHFIFIATPILLTLILCSQIQMNNFLTESTSVVTTYYSSIYQTVLIWAPVSTADTTTRHLYVRLLKWMTEILLIGKGLNLFSRCIVIRVDKCVQIKLDAVPG